MKLNKLKELREQKGYTQQTLSTKMGMSVRAYAYKENGQRDFSVEELEQILYYLDINANELLEPHRKID